MSKRQRDRIKDIKRYLEIAASYDQTSLNACQFDIDKQVLSIFFRDAAKGPRLRGRSRRKIKKNK